MRTYYWLEFVKAQGTDPLPSTRKQNGPSSMGPP